MRTLRRWRKKSLYQKSLIIFTLLLIILGIVFLVYVWNSMIIYERSLPENYIKYLGTSGKLSENIDFKISDYEEKNVNIEKSIKKIYKSDDLVIKKNNSDKNNDENIVTYDVIVNDNVINKVSLKNINTYTKMAILTINEWEIEKIENNFENGIYNYEISVPQDYIVLVNDNILKNKDIIKEGDVEGLERLTDHIEINKSKTYAVNGLVNEPEIKITDKNNKEIEFEIKDNKIIVGKDFKEIKKYDDAKKYIKDNFDIMALAENWSLFLTDDLKGAYHGFYLLTPYLIENTYMYEMAYGWSHNVDITFVSSHYLKNPVFTNERLENFVIYNDNAFSCEVYLEKNMVVSGKDKVDIMHDRLYFIYYEGSYKLVNMESI